MSKDDEAPGVRVDGKLLGVVVALLGAFGSGFGSNYLWLRTNPEALSEFIRPDPFTGTQGRALERKIDAVASDLRELSNRFDRHEPEELVQRVTVTELQIRRIERDIKEHGIEHKE